MYSQRTNPDILQTFRHVINNNILAIPSQTSLCRHRNFHGLHDLFGHLHHQRYIPEHSRPSSFCRHPFHRTTKIYIDKIRLNLFNYFCRLDHGINKPPVNLYRHRTFILFYRQLLNRLVYRAHQCICRHEFRIEPVSPVTFTEFPKRGIGNLFHRGQNQRPISYIFSSDNHLQLNKFCHKNNNFYL